MQELINFVTLNGGQRHLQAVDSIIDNVVSPGPDVTLRLNDEDAEDVSSLYLKVKKSRHELFNSKNITEMVFSSFIMPQVFSCIINNLVQHDDQ